MEDTKYQLKGWAEPKRCTMRDHAFVICIGKYELTQHCLRHFEDCHQLAFRFWNGNCPQITHLKAKHSYLSLQQQFIWLSTLKGRMLSAISHFTRHICDPTCTESTAQSWELGLISAKCSPHLNSDPCRMQMGKFKWNWGRKLPAYMPVPS